ncbi:MAG: hypothetical protein IZT59_07690 [Verrucomicrobia bacterium]|jgi:hypothetical protein|nr:hypothetical protein [Verrucomicrobiota bacterium]|tara:strand:+ start:35747 stop:35902 length:156 start_codon:yes stop_codon:yes gene_type:complete
MFEKPLEPLNYLVASGLLERNHDDSRMIGKLLTKRVEKVSIRGKNHGALWR